MQRSAWRPTGSASASVRPLSSSTRWNSCGPSPGRDARPHRRVRVHPLARWTSAAAAAGTPRGRASVGSSFSMPMTVIRTRAASGTSGRCPRTRRPRASRSRRPRSWRRRRRPAPGGTSRAGAARAASASAAGSSVRSAGAGRPTAAIRRRKMSRISVRLRWIAGTRMCDGQVAAELDDQLREVGLPGGDPCPRPAPR